MVSAPSYCQLLEDVPKTKGVGDVPRGGGFGPLVADIGADGGRGGLPGGNLFVDNGGGAGGEGPLPGGALETTTCGNGVDARRNRKKQTPAVTPGMS